MELNSTVSASELGAFSAISLHIELVSQFISYTKLTPVRKTPRDALRKRGNVVCKVRSGLSFGVIPLLDEA